MMQSLPLRGGEADGRHLESFIAMKNLVSVGTMAPKVCIEFHINLSIPPVLHFEGFLLYEDKSKFQELETSP